MPREKAGGGDLFTRRLLDSPAEMTDGDRGGGGYAGISACQLSDFI